MSPAPVIRPAELDRMLIGAEPPVILDATLTLHPPRFDGDFRAECGRPQWERVRIPGAVHVAVDTDLSVPDATHSRHPQPQQLADALARLGIGAQSPVVTYDSAGGLWAARVWYLLRWIGIHVRVLDGGLAGWQAAGGPVESGPGRPVVPTPRWDAHAVRDAWIEKHELVTVLGAAPNLVCALSPGVFTGAEPTRYTRRGHIPGSSNVPARTLFDENGCLRAGLDIEARFREAGADLNAELLLYCGGGISAAANALALAAIGIDNVRIYDGSLEEWSADPTLPVAVGPVVPAAPSQRDRGRPARAYHQRR